MKLIFRLMSLVAIGMVALPSYALAAEPNAKTLLYISPNDYHYSVRLFFPYEGYWFEQGPLVEAISLKALQAKDASTAICNGNERAQRVIRIKPSVFYNPQVHMYYSQLAATVFSGKGDVLGSYVGKAQQYGASSFAGGVTMHLNQVYDLAMQNLMTQLNAVPTVSTSLANTENNLPCGLIGTQNDPKINFY